jgi:peptidoglycan/xylan/chitin deacetylase (PgdA/CDA1 family)
LRPRTDTLVLAYHAVSGTWPSTLAVSPRGFEGQIATLLDRGYRSVTFHDAVHGRPAGKRLAVTFDDAYLSVLENAFPVLDRLGVLATVFVPTDYAGSGRPMRWDGIEQWGDGSQAPELIPISWARLAELRDAGWEVGSHTRSHPHLTRIGDEDLDAELRGSKRACEERLEVPCRSLAYPYGEHDDRVVAAAQRAGYSAAGTLPSSLQAAGPLRWPRIGIYPADEARRRFEAKVSPLARALRSSAGWRVLAKARRRAGPSSVS